MSYLSHIASYHIIPHSAYIVSHHIISNLSHEGSYCITSHLTQAEEAKICSRSLSNQINCRRGKHPPLFRITWMLQDLQPPGLTRTEKENSMESFRKWQHYTFGSSELARYRKQLSTAKDKPGKR